MMEMKANKQTILDHLRDTGGSTSIEVAWSLQHQLNPVLTELQIGVYLSSLPEVQHVDGKYQLRKTE